MNNRTKYTISILASVLLVSIGISIVFTLETPEEDFTGDMDPVVNDDPYMEAYEELIEWWDGRKSIPSIENFSMAGIAVGSNKLFVVVDESDADQIDRFADELALLHPELNIIVDTIGEATWLTGDIVSICTSETDDCVP